MKHAVLVVEDHRSLRDGMVLALDWEGFVAIPASGDEALQYLRSGGRPSLILLNLTFDGMDGWAFRQVQNDNPMIAEIPVIVVSGCSAGELRGLGGLPAYAALLEKPFSSGALVTKVREIVDGRSAAAH